MGLWNFVLCGPYFKEPGLVVGTFVRTSVLFSSLRQCVQWCGLSLQIPKELRA